MRKTLYALSLLLVASAAHSADFSIGLSNTAIAVDYTSAPIGKGLEFTLGGLHHVDNGNVGTFGMQVSQQVNQTFKVTLGGKAVGVFNDTKNVSALALGGEVDMAMPAIPKIHLAGHAWLAPGVTSSSGAKNFQDLRVSVGYHVLNNAEIYVAYRHIQIDYDKYGERKIEDGPLFGLKMYF